jgi:hypothetical protein
LFGIEPVYALAHHLVVLFQTKISVKALFGLPSSASALSSTSITGTLRLLLRHQSAALNLAMAHNHVENLDYTANLSGLEKAEKNTS